jgi:hypothetical protein
VPARIRKCLTYPGTHSVSRSVRSSPESSQSCLHSGPPLANSLHAESEVRIGTVSARYRYIALVPKSRAG